MDPLQGGADMSDVRVLVQVSISKQSRGLPHVLPVVTPEETHKALGALGLPNSPDTVEEVQAEVGVWLVQLPSFLAKADYFEIGRDGYVIEGEKP
jgi:hypothetical protein